MTLQERMIAVYLRQAKLPEVEREKLRLFLGLLLETMDEDESDEGPFPAAHAPEAGKTGLAVQNGAAEETPVAPPAAPEQKGQEWKPEHPFVRRILRIMERRELSKLRTAKEIGISDVGLAAILEGRNRPRKDTEDLIERWIIREEQAAGTADSE